MGYLRIWKDIFGYLFGANSQMCNAVRRRNWSGCGASSGQSEGSRTSKRAAKGSLVGGRLFRRGDPGSRRHAPQFLVASVLGCLPTRLAANETLEPAELQAVSGQLNMDAGSEGLSCGANGASERRAEARAGPRQRARRCGRAAAARAARP